MKKKKGKIKRKIRTERQKKLVMLIWENMGKTPPLTMTEMMLRAGYSEETSREQSSILEGVRDDLKPLIIQLLELRQQAIERMRKTGSYIGYKNALEGLDKLTKNIQLLSGRPTERPQMTLDDETKAALDKLMT